MRNNDANLLREMFEKSQDNIETDITLFGNKYTIFQIVTLLAYIRNAINNNMKSKIEVMIGNNVSDRDFYFFVNDQKADDVIVKNRIEIN